MGSIVEERFLALYFLRPFSVFLVAGKVRFLRAGVLRCLRDSV